MTLILGLPSKGRMKEQARSFLTDCGFTIDMQSQRDYHGKLGPIDNIQIEFLQASEIALRLGDGRLDCGITGLDLLAEKGIQSQVYNLDTLDFGHAQLVLTVPQSWFDVNNLQDLEEIAYDFRQTGKPPMRVATKYMQLVGQFLQQHGISDYQLVYSAGATEATPASGEADIVADITSTGATLAANHLKILDDGLILASQAVFSASLKTDWPDNKRQQLGYMLDLMQGRKQSFAHCLVIANIQNQHMDRILSDLQTLSPLDLHQSAGKIFCIIKRTLIHQIAAILRPVASSGITVLPTDYVFLDANRPLHLFENHLNSL